MTRSPGWIFFAILLTVAPASAAELILVERPIDGSSPGAPHGSCTSGSRLVHLDAHGGSRVLTADFDGACDPSVSFDGLEILFSGKKASTDRWRIWRMDLMTGHASAITDNSGDAFAPLWVGSIFHLDDESPTRRFAYLTTGNGTGSIAVLHTANLDGSDTLRISYAPGGDLEPDILPNGRIVYPMVGTDESVGATLMGLNIDGTDLAAFADPHDSPGLPHNVRVGSDGRVYFIESGTRTPDEGALVFVSMRRPLRTRTVLATTKDGHFLDPAPMADGSLLASFRPKGPEGYVLARIDSQYGQPIETVHRIDGFHVLDAHEVAARPVVPGRSTVVDLDKDTGVFFCISSHITDRPSLAHLRDGEAARLRVVEYRTDLDPVISERVLGETPIESDGSFHIEVPARTPVRFQLLDDEGATIAEQRSWTWVMPREWRGCIGCHENREMVAPNVLAEAVVKPAVRMIEPESVSGGGE